MTFTKRGPMTTQPDNDPLGLQAEAAAIAALDKAVQALRGVYPDERPAHVVYLLRQLDMNDNDLTAVFRAVSDRLAWGDWRD